METLLQFCPNFTPVVKLGSFPINNNKQRNLNLNCNVKLRAISRNSSDGSTKDGLLLDTEKDESGSVIGFRFVSQSGILNYLLVFYCMYQT